MGGSIMASIINASTSGAGGLISTADASGVLQLQTAGTTAVTVDASQNVGIGTASPTYKLDVSSSGPLRVSGGSSQAGGIEFCGNASTYGSTSMFVGQVGNGDANVNQRANLPLVLATNNTERWRIDSTGNLSNTGASGTAYLTLKAGTATASTAPIKLTAGTNLSAVEAGAVEYDGSNQYFTANSTIGRGFTPTTQIFRLTANGTAIGPAINAFFGINSSVFLPPGGAYEIEAYCYFTKTTAGTVTITATTSLAPVNLNGIVQFGPATGGTAQGASGQISLFNSTATASAFGASTSLTTGVNHAMIIRLIVEPNASLSTLRINFTSSAGTVTPLRGSYYKVTRLPASNTGSFTA